MQSLGFRLDESDRAIIEVDLFDTSLLGGNLTHKGQPETPNIVAPLKLAITHEVF